MQHAKHNEGECRNVVFSDKKEFNLDELDGQAYYWRNLQKDGRKVSRHQHGSGSVIIRSLFSCHVRGHNAFMEGRHNAMKYSGKLQEHLLL